METENDVVYVGIGNSDDKLTQIDWSLFVREVRDLCEEAGHIAGAWFSEPAASWQNACFCVRTIKPSRRAWLRYQLIRLTEKYKQDYISYVEGETILLNSRKKDDR